MNNSLQNDLDNYVLGLKHTRHLCVGIDETSHKVLHDLYILLETIRGFQYVHGKLRHQDEKSDFLWIDFANKKYYHSDNNGFESDSFILHLDHKAMNIIRFFLDSINPIT